jgi:hypothetical protein
MRCDKALETLDSSSLRKKRATKSLAPNETIACVSDNGALPAQSQQPDPAYLAKVEEVMRLATGTGDNLLASRLFRQMEYMQIWGSDQERVANALQLFVELHPTNATESMLAIQMVGVHDATLVFLKDATLKEQTSEGRDRNVLRTTRLMRLFLEQIEAMQRLKGKAGQQKVIVKHVHVNEGGQAIVGTVTARANASDD